MLLTAVRDGLKFPPCFKAERKTMLKIGTLFFFKAHHIRFKSLIHKIYKDGDDDDIEEI